MASQVEEPLSLNSEGGKMRNGDSSIEPAFLSSAPRSSRLRIIALEKKVASSVGKESRGLRE